VIAVFDYFLCSSYHYDFLNFWISYLFGPTRLSYYSSKLSNVWEKSTSQIRQNYPAPVGFLPEPDFCRIWKKCRIPAGAKIRYNAKICYCKYAEINCEWQADDTSQWRNECWR